MVVLTLLWMSILSQGRWRGIYTPPRNLSVGAFNEAVVPEVQAVLPENSGTTGPGIGRPAFKLHKPWPQRYHTWCYRKAVVLQMATGTTGHAVESATWSKKLSVTTA